MLTKPDLNKPFFQFNKQAAEAVRANRCTSCNIPIFETDFKDDLSKQEYSISGLCQRCQDKAFRPRGSDDDE